MIASGGLGVMIESGRLPLLPEVLAYAGLGLISGGLTRNKEYRQAMIDVSSQVSRAMLDVFHDPQTSGGLLVALVPEQAIELVDRLQARACPEAAIIGTFTGTHPGRIVLN
jgi:selenide,water dikinase